MICANCLNKKASIEKQNIGNDIVQHSLDIYLNGKLMYFATPGRDTFDSFYIIFPKSNSMDLTKGGKYNLLHLPGGEYITSFNEDEFKKYLSSQGITSLDTSTKHFLNSALRDYGGLRVLSKEGPTATMARYFAALGATGELKKSLSSLGDFKGPKDIKGKPQGMAGGGIGRSYQRESQGDEEIPNLLKISPGNAFKKMLGPRARRTFAAKGYYTLSEIDNGNLKAAVSSELRAYLKAKGLDLPNLDEEWDDLDPILLLIVLDNKVDTLVGKSWNALGSSRIAKVEEIKGPKELLKFNITKRLKATLVVVGIERD